MNYKNSASAVLFITGIHFFFSSCNQAPAETRPNILLLVAEDISPALGCYGDEYATTPNTDKMAENGIVYDLALSTAPISAPSRSPLVSGLYATSLGTQHLRSEIPFPDKLKNLTELLTEHGCFTSNRDKETIVFFIGDHGFGMPRYKRWLYKTGLQVPMVVHVREKYQYLVPGFSMGGHIEHLTSLIDLPATILNLAGAKVPEYFEGEPMIRVLYRMGTRVGFTGTG